MDYDVFISHASEDKESVARPLTEALQARGYDVWLDEMVLLIGDPLLAKIDDGLARSRFGVVILSEAFFSKQWTNAELAGLTEREMAQGGVVILPVMHGVSRDQVRSFSPILASKLAGTTSNGTEHLADQIVARLEHQTEPTDDETSNAAPSPPATSSPVPPTSGSTVPDGWPDDAAGFEQRLRSTLNGRGGFGPVRRREPTAGPSPTVAAAPALHGRVVSPSPLLEIAGAPVGALPVWSGSTHAWWPSGGQRAGDQFVWSPDGSMCARWDEGGASVGVVGRSGKVIWWGAELEIGSGELLAIQAYDLSASVLVSGPIGTKRLLVHPRGSHEAQSWELPAAAGAWVPEGVVWIDADGHAHGPGRAGVPPAAGIVRIDAACWTEVDWTAEGERIDVEHWVVAWLQGTTLEVRRRTHSLPSPPGRPNTVESNVVELGRGDVDRVMVARGRSDGPVGVFVVADDEVFRVTVDVEHLDEHGS